MGWRKWYSVEELIIYLLAAALIIIGFIVGIIVIIGTIIYMFIYKSNESFTGVPRGYTNMVVSDHAGNTSTFSLGSLETAVAAISDTRTADVLRNYYYTRSQTDRRIFNLQNEINEMKSRLGLRY